MNSQFKNNDDHKKMPKDNPFGVPEGYFEDLTERIESRIVQDNNKNKKVIRFWKSAKNQFALAAGIALFVAISYSVMHFVVNKSPESQLLNSQYAEVIESELDEYEIYMIEEAYIDTQEQPASANEDLMDDEMIEYLIAEDIDVDLIIEEL